MKQIILYIAAYLGGFVNFIAKYPEHLKNKFHNNKLIQLKTIILFLHLLSIIYFYFYFTKDGWFSYFSLFSALVFCLLSILFYGFFISKKNTNLNLDLQQKVGHFFKTYATYFKLLTSSSTSFGVL